MITCRFISLEKLINAMSFYAVRKGRNPGVYETWSECQQQVVKFTGAKFRKFLTKEEALAFVNEQQSPAGKGVFACTTDDQSMMSYNIQSKLQSIISTMNLFKQQLTALSGLGEKLTSEVEELKSSVSSSGFSPTTRMSPSASTAHGIKRSLSTDTGWDGLCPQPPKKPDLKKAKSSGENVDHWTGKKFRESDGVIVYTDGACSQNGKNGARAGLGVFWGSGDSRNLSERLTGRPTNNRAEIHAARRAVEQAKAYGIKNLVLHTDSQFLINSITTWIKGWKKNDWVKTTGEPVINKEDFLELDAVIKDINVKWVHVRGHCGIPGNEAADRLANEGARKSLT